MKIVTDTLVLIGLITGALLWWYWEEVNFPKLLPDRAAERYTTAPLTLTTAEHIRVMRNGRYITVCYWITVNKTQAVQVSHCTTEKELFNGY